MCLTRAEPVILAGNFKMSDLGVFGGNRYKMLGGKGLWDFRGFCDFGVVLVWGLQYFKYENMF